VPDYIFFMHNDARGSENDWGPYLANLKHSGSFEGGSAAPLEMVSACGNAVRHPL
jgi:hypothetical protein